MAKGAFYYPESCTRLMAAIIDNGMHCLIDNGDERITDEVREGITEQLDAMREYADYLESDDDDEEEA